MGMSAVHEKDSREVYDAYDHEEVHTILKTMTN